MKKMYKFLCGDAKNVLVSIPSDSVDLVVTSPPYDAIRTYKGYTVDLLAIGKHLHRVMKDGSVLAMVLGDGTSDFGKSITVARTIVQYVDDVGFKLFEDVIYHRNGRPGAWWNQRFRVDHEHILLFLKGRKPKHFDKEPLKVPALHAGNIFYGTQRRTNGDMAKILPTEQASTKCRGTVWFYHTSNSEGNRLKLQHPATFPDRLAEDLITCFSSPGDVILDPFSGSGTTVRMAEKLRRDSIGIDISPEYISLSMRIIENENIAIPDYDKFD